MPDDSYHGSGMNYQGPPSNQGSMPGGPQVPVDSMQGLDLGSQHGSNFAGPMDMPDLGTGDLHFEGMDNSMRQNQPHDQSQMAAWFDTDL